MPPEDYCAYAASNQIYKDFWIGYTPPCYGTIEVNTFGSHFDTKIAVYANADNSTCPLGSNTAIACNDEFFSHRRDRGTTGRQGVIGYVA